MDFPPESQAQGGSPMTKERQIEMRSLSNRTLKSGFMLALVLLGGVAWLDWRHTNQMQATAELVSHTHEVQANLNELLKLVDDIETGERGFVITGDPKFLEPYESGLKAVPELQRRLEQLILNPEQKARLTELERLIAERIVVAQREVNLRRDSGFEAARQDVASGVGRAMHDQIRVRFSRMDALNRTLLDARSAAARREAGTTRLMTIIGESLGIGLLIAVFALVLRENRLRQQANLALHASEENLSVTLHSIGDAVLATDVNGRVTRMNPIAEKLTGWMQAEAAGRPIAEVFHIINEETRQPALIPVAKVLETGTIQGLANHTVVIARDGTEWPIADSAAPIRDREGRVLGVILVFRDVTEEKKAEREIRESQQRLKLALDAAQIGDWELDMVTQSACRSLRHDQIFGYTEILPEWNYSLFLKHVHPADRDRVDRSFKESVAAGRDWYFECRIIRADQTTGWIWARGSIFKDNTGQPKSMHGMVGDITERKRVEEEIRSFNERLEALVSQRTAEVQEALTTLDATADGAYIFDPASLRFTYVNKGALRQLGYTREELLKKTPLDLNKLPDKAAFLDLVAPLIRGEKSVLTLESVFHRKGGGKFPVEINLQYITPAGGSPRFVAIVRDITERKKNEQESRRAQRLESIGTLAGGIAHDLNNALTPILWGLEIMRVEYPKASQTLDMFETCAKRGADMVRQLLSFAKGAEGERVVLEPVRLVKEMDKLIRSTFPKNIELVVRCDPKLPNVIGDATQLHQVLLNLCVNARDAMPHGGTLMVEALPLELDATYASSMPDARPGKYVALRVSDTGTGIPPEILDRIFDPFFTTKGPQKGTGLGLSTVIGILKGHGGFIQVYSQPGKGSTFTAYLPADQSGNVAEPIITKTEAAFSGQGEAILFVDDEANLRQAARAVLRRLNFTPLTATDGTDGLIQMAQHRDELRAIITDLHMPHMDGLAFVRALRRNLPDIPVVVASGRLENALAGEFKILGVTNFLDKPFTEAQLAAVLKTVLHK